MKEENELNELVTKLYLDHEKTVTPLFPKVLVRLLPKEHRTKQGLWLPESSQNKPVHEGIVLETYKPFWHDVWQSRESYVKITSPALLDEEEHLQAIWQECAVKTGDHVVFPHMALGITPVWPLDDGRGDYRLVPEGEILGKISYEVLTAEETLAELLDDTEYSSWEPKDWANWIAQHFDLLRKALTSVTMSGR
jgi:co-chaperonin GroES (HSP10)